MKRMNCVIGLCLLLSGSLLGQSKIWGSLTYQNQPVAYANMLLFSKDSIFIKGEITNDDGQFEFNPVDSGYYYLQISSLGYRDITISNIEIIKQDKDLGNIALTEQTQSLETVTVTAKKPLLEQQAGKLIVNVENAVVGANGSVQDLLKRVPGMLVVNDQLQMVGKPNVNIYIDGKPTQYMDVQSLLKEMAADNIQKIEVITQADASYDAAGTGGIINIVLKKNVSLGTNGSARVSVAKGIFWGYNGNVSLNHRKNKLNTTFSGSFAHNTSWHGLNVGRIVGNKYFEQESFSPSLPLTYSLNAGLDYDLSDRHSCGIAFKGTTSNNDRINTSASRIFEGLDNMGPLIQAFETNSIVDNHWNYGTFDTYYKFKIDTSGQEFKISGNVSNYDRETFNQINSQGIQGDLIPIESIRNNQPSDVNIKALTVDYSKPFNSRFKMKIGGKWSKAKIDANVQATTEVDSQWVNNIDLSNHFIFEETISALYTNASFSINSVEISLGLRFEDTRSIGNSLTLDSINNRKYNHLFPSASVFVPITEKVGISTAYSYRINRPRYNSLNPFVTFINPISFQRGNPFLQPELTHSMKLSITFEKQPFINFEYNRTSDVIEIVSQQDDDTGIAFGQDINLDQYDQIGGSFFFPIDFIHKSVSGYGGVMMYHNWYGSNYLVGYFDESQFTATAFLQANLKIAQNLKMELVGWYRGKSVEGIMRGEPLYGLNAGFEQKLFDGKGTLSLNIDDLLFKYWNGTIDYQNQQMSIVSSWQTQSVKMSFTYRFGNQFINKKDRLKSSSIEENRRAQLRN